MSNFIKIAQEVLNSEAQALIELANKLGQEFEKAVSLMLNSKGRVIVMGIGKSGIIGRKISATLASTGTPSFFIHPSEAYHGDLGMITADDLILAISNSGETEELIRLIPIFKENKNILISISNRAESTLFKNSDVGLNLNVKKEACRLDLVPTTSTTVTLALGDALAVCLMEKKQFKQENFAKFHPGGQLGRKLLSTVAEVMQKDNIPWLNEDESFVNVISIITQGRLGVGVVKRADGTLLGIITDGDIRRILLQKNEAAIKMKASEYCSKNPIIVSGNLKLIEAEKIIHDKKVTTLLVGSALKVEGILHIHHI